MKVKVSGVAALTHGEAKTFSFEREGQAQQGFVIRYGEQLYAYHNRCPHWGVDLDMGEGRFFSAITNRLFCSSHGALFEPTTGYCDAGPCAGDSLERFELSVVEDEAGDVVVLEIADEDPMPF